MLQMGGQNFPEPQNPKPRCLQNYTAEDTEKSKEQSALRPQASEGGLLQGAFGLFPKVQALDVIPQSAV